MISLESFRNQLCNLVEEQFTDVKFVIDERRSTTLEIRIFFTPEIFMEAYVNGITGKKSFALVKNRKRIWGYDNYRYWHHHPIEKPDNHIPCSEPPLEKIVNELRTVLSQIQG
jgi:hypothetical protein